MLIRAQASDLYYKLLNTPTLDDAVASHERDISMIADAMEKVSGDTKRLVSACERLGSWMSAALEDPKVCDAMKADIEEFFEALGPFPFKEK